MNRYPETKESPKNVMTGQKLLEYSKERHCRKVKFPCVGCKSRIGERECIITILQRDYQQLD